MGKKLLVAGNNAPKSVIEALVKQGYTQILTSCGTFKDDSVYCELAVGNGEAVFARKELLKDAEVVFVQSCSSDAKYSQNDNAMMALGIAHTAKKSGAKTVTAVLPFAPYERQDQRKDEGRHTSQMGELFPMLMKTAGVDKVLTCSPHSHKAVGHWRAVFGNCHAFVDNALILGGAIFKYAYENKLDLVVGAPDGGDKPDDMAQQEAKKLAGVLKDAPMFYIDKVHTGVNDTQVKGFRCDEGTDIAGQDTLVIDDMSDTCGTLKNGGKALFQKGAKSVTGALGHGLASEEALEDVISIRVSEGGQKLFIKLFFTDSCPAILAKVESLRTKYPDINDKVTVVETGFHIAEKLAELEQVQVPSGRAK